MISLLPNTLRHTSALIGATLAIIAAEAADQAPGKPPLDLGDSVPAGLTLRTEKDNPYDLNALFDRQPAVIVFYRGGWCPYCNAHLAALVDIEKDLQALGVRLVAISPDQPAKLRDAPGRKKEPGFLLLSDQDMAVADAFGIAFTVPPELVSRYRDDHGIDLESASGRSHHRLPYPSVFVVDTAGVIRFAHINPDYRVRLEPARILAAVKAALPKP